MLLPLMKQEGYSLNNLTENELRNLHPTKNFKYNGNEGYWESILASPRKQPSCQRHN